MITSSHKLTALILFWLILLTLFGLIGSMPISYIDGLLTAEKTMQIIAIATLLSVCLAAVEPTAFDKKTCDSWFPIDKPIDNPDPTFRDLFV